MVEQLRAPCSAFKKVVMAHFSLRGGVILDTCTRWDDTAHKDVDGTVPEGWGASPLPVDESSWLHQLEDQLRKLGGTRECAGDDFSSDDESDEDD
jgi:hypothetical protein